MGYWGIQLYANDTTCDVRDSYRAYLEQQCTAQQAYEKLLEEYSEYIGDEEEPLVWYALADSAWRVGRISDELKEKALAWISKEGGISLFEESPRAQEGWRRTLRKLKEKLETPQPKEKKIRPPQVLNQNPWNLYDVYAYQFHTEEEAKYGLDGKYILMQKIREEKREYQSRSAKRLDGVYMFIQVFDKIFDRIPVLEDIRDVRILPMQHPLARSIPCMYAVPMCFKNNREYPAAFLTYIGNIPSPVDTDNLKLFGCADIFWKSIGKCAASWHNAWMPYSYEYDENGVAHNRCIPDE